jgi:hypothetical protein
VSSIHCRMFNNAENQIGRTFVYYQSQNKHCRRLHEFMSTKEITLVHVKKRSEFYSVWIEENSYYNLLGV